MWDGFNKRKFPRVSLRCEVRIHPDAGASPIRAVTENLGVGGVCVILDQPLERFDRCRIRIEVDETLPQVDCSGKVMWTIPTRGVQEKKARFDTGIEFVDLKKADAELIKNFIARSLPSVSTQK